MTQTVLNTADHIAIAEQLAPRLAKLLSHSTVTQADYAQRLRITERTLRQMARDKRVPAPINLAARPMVWRAEDVL
jgi:DNA-binding Xre family transcriptional regulator